MTESLSMHSSKHSDGRRPWVKAVLLATILSLPIVASEWPAAYADTAQDIKDCMEERPGAVIAACTRLVDDPTTAERMRTFAYNKRGLGFLDLKQYDKALADFDEAIRLLDFYSDAYWGRAKAYAAKGDHARAAADEAKAISLQPAPAGAIIRHAQGVTEMRRKRYDRAIDEFDRALKIDPHHIKSLSDRGETHLGLGQLDRALSDFDRVVALAPTDAVAHNDKAWTLLRLGRLSEALESANRSISLKRGAHNVDTLARIEAAMGRHDEALASYKAAIDLGGAKFVRLYQRGLKQLDRFGGSIDGVATAELYAALETCVRQGCEPPSDQQ
jgi:tetratricopeptide (TPR) repeat protein